MEVGSWKNEEPLSESQIATFLEDGVLVVPDVLTAEEVRTARKGLDTTLQSHGVDVANLLCESSSLALARLSSTNGSGGVLDLFYDAWKMEVATHPKLFALTKQLWKAAYCSKGEALEDLPLEKRYMWHPYGPVEFDKGYMYMDRIGFRLPTTLAAQMGDLLHGSHVSRKKRRPIQRSLTPHLDCCPDTIFQGENNKNKWRPIQCFVSLTDNLQSNTGGFEAAKGFHREFDQWRMNRAPSHKPNGEQVPAPCLGEYTHIRPLEDKEVMDRVQHIPVPAGAAVLWDVRIPHANAYRHEGFDPRCVVYASFLPDVALNRCYVQRQLEDWRLRRSPTDQWIRPGEDGRQEGAESKDDDYTFSELGKKLIGIKPW